MDPKLLQKLNCPQKDTNPLYLVIITFYIFYFKLIVQRFIFILMHTSKIDQIMGVMIILGKRLKCGPLVCMVAPIHLDISGFTGNKITTLWIHYSFFGKHIYSFYFTKKVLFLKFINFNFFFHF